MATSLIQTSLIYGFKSYTPPVKAEDRMASITRGLPNGDPLNERGHIFTKNTVITYSFQYSGNRCRPVKQLLNLYLRTKFKNDPNSKDCRRHINSDPNRYIRL